MVLSDPPPTNPMPWKSRRPPISSNLGVPHLRVARCRNDSWDPKVAGQSVRRREGSFEAPATFKDPGCAAQCPLRSRHGVSGLGDPLADTAGREGRETQIQLGAMGVHYC